MDILNHEFACKHEILVLPKIYGTLDSEFYPPDPLSSKLSKCKNFSRAQYIHFSARGKPW